jgi:hypothetical protein
MISNYNPEWQDNRINFILKHYPVEFFQGKRILELGSFNGYIGYRFSLMGADVHCLEGRQDNVDNIRRDYPSLNVELANLDTPDWRWGNWDIIINFGLYYHLEHYHKEHMIYIIKNYNDVIKTNIYLQSSKFNNMNFVMKQLVLDIFAKLSVNIPGTIGYYEDDMVDLKFLHMFFDSRHVHL